MEKHQIEVQGRKSLPLVFLVFDLDYILSDIVLRRDILQELEPDFFISRSISTQQEII